MSVSVAVVAIRLQVGGCLVVKEVMKSVEQATIKNKGSPCELRVKGGKERGLRMSE